MKKMFKRYNTRSITPGELHVIRQLEKPPKYKLLGSIGKGATAEVHRARGNSGLIPFEYAVKICTLEPQRSESDTDSASATHASESQQDQGEMRKVTLEQCQAEIKILRALQTKDNRRMVHLFDCFSYEDEVWTVMEFMPFNLRSLLWLRDKTKKERLLVWDAAIYVREIVRALQFLRSNRVVHRDLKPGNILLSNSGRVKLCDFGISEVIPEGQEKLVVNRNDGTKEYMASEMFISGAPYDYNVDVWALGQILYNLCNHGHTALNGAAKQFRGYHFKYYEKGFAQYIDALCGGRFLSKEQYRIVSGKENPSYLGSRYDAIRDFVQRCFVPLPSTGTVDYPVTRKVTERRLTLKEALQWTEKTLVGYSELSCRNTVIQHVKECHRLREEVDAAIREIKDTEDSDYIEQEMMYYEYCETN